MKITKSYSKKKTLRLVEAFLNEHGAVRIIETLRVLGDYNPFDKSGYSTKAFRLTLTVEPAKTLTRNKK